MINFSFKIPAGIKKEGTYWCNYAGKNGFMAIRKPFCNELSMEFTEDGLTPVKKRITQILADDGKTKITTVERKDFGVSNSNRHQYLSVQTIDNAGQYSVIRNKYKGNKLISTLGHYTFNEKPVNRTFAQGFKGKCQKFALSVATDKNGCEKLLLKNLGELILKITKNIR